MTRPNIYSSNVSLYYFNALCSDIRCSWLRCLNTGIISARPWHIGWVRLVAPRCNWLWIQGAVRRSFVLPFLSTAACLKQRHDLQCVADIGFGCQQWSASSFGMHRRFGQNFCLAKYLPFLLWFGLAKAVTELAESTTTKFDWTDDLWIHHSSNWVNVCCNFCSNFRYVTLYLRFGVPLVVIVAVRSEIASLHHWWLFFLRRQCRLWLNLFRHCLC